MIRVRRYLADGTVFEGIDPEEVSECLQQRGTLLWVDVEDATREDAELLRAEFGVHHLAVEDVLEPTPRPRLGRFKDHHLLAIHDPCLVGGRFTTREIDLVFGEGWLISVRKPPPGGGAGPSPAGELAARFERQRRAEGATDEGFLLYAIVDTVVDRCFDVADELEASLERVEADIFATDGGGPIRQAHIVECLYQLRSDLVRFQRAVAPLPDALGSLARDNQASFESVSGVYLRDVEDLSRRLRETLVSQLELVNAALAAHLSLASNRMNLVMKQATSWGAILVIATLVAGVYGMNFEHMPELGWRFGYAWALGLMGGITLMLYLTFKRRDWL